MFVAYPVVVTALTGEMKAQAQGDHAVGAKIKSLKSLLRICQ